MLPVVMSVPPAGAVPVLGHPISRRCRCPIARRRHRSLANPWRSSSSCHIRHCTTCICTDFLNFIVWWFVFFLLLFASFAYNNLLYLRCSSSRDCFFSFLCFACNGKSLITAFLFIVSNDLNACCSWNMHMINNHFFIIIIKARGLVSSQT